MSATPEHRSPFLVIPEFLSPSLCEQIIDSLDLIDPDKDEKLRPKPIWLEDTVCSAIVTERMSTIVDRIEEFYSPFFVGERRTPVKFMWIQGGSAATQPSCANSDYSEGKWLQVKPYSLTCSIFLSDYNEKMPFDSDYEVYGGKNEFITHRFGFNPQRGTLVIHPSGPHFVNSFAEVKYGDLFLAQMHLVGKEPFLYNPQDFPGNYKLWFRDIGA